MVHGCNLKMNKSMKRYLYILLAAVTLSACEYISTITANAEITLGATEVECTTDSATIITDMPTVLVNGTPYTEYTLSLTYVERELEGSVDYTNIDIYYLVNDKVKFNIEGLEQDTEYVAYINLDAGTYGSAHSAAISFTTKSNTPVATIECASKVDAKGVMATVTLQNVTYKVDGASKTIEYVRIEYCEADNTNEWCAIDVDDYGKAITIPAEYDNYLTENTEYIYRVAIIPEDRNLEPLTTEDKTFTTTNAVVTADIEIPELTLKATTLDIVVKGYDLRFDGVTLNGYKDVEYGFQYRKEGDQWSNLITAELKNNGIKHSMERNLFDAGATYEFRGAAVAGPKDKLCTSESTTITIPMSDDGGNDDGGNDDGDNDDGGNDDGGDDDIPTPPAPPTPPMTGDADTSDIAGEWHLTSWCGSEPSFDVYLSISTDGVVSLFQRMESRQWETYYSTVGYEDSLIYGQYTDGTSWATSYYVSIDGDTMVWTSAIDSDDVSVYTRCTLPNFTNVTRSATTNSKRFL